MYSECRFQLPESTTKSFWRRAQTCVDYRVYVCDFPQCDDARWRWAVARMRMLGRCESNACGVTYVRGAWGFFQIPARGFPELKVTFFHFTRRRQRRVLLSAITHALRDGTGAGRGRT